MRPDPQLAGLLGLTSAGGTLANGYLQVDTNSGPGRGDRRPDDPVPRDRRPLHDQRRPDDRHPLLGRHHRHGEPRGDPAKRGLQRRPRRRLHLRPRPLDRRDAPGQPRLVGRRARQLGGREPADPLRRSLLRRQDRGRAARLGRPQQGRDPAGRRAAAPAHQPDRADEPGPQAAAAVLVPAPRREGGGGDDRRRPRQRRHRGALPAVSRPTAPRAARSPTGSACAAPPTSTRAPRSATRRPPPSRARASRSPCT